MLFGGRLEGGLSQETWTYDGTTWEKQAPSESPSARQEAMMAYDPATGKMVLFGGTTGIGESSETWTYDGTTWEKQSTTTSPSARKGASMAYDPALGEMVLFAGEEELGGPPFNETWLYNGKTWSPYTPIETAPSHVYGSMGYDPVTGLLVLFGGDTSEHLNETWTFNGMTWAKQTTSESPSPRDKAMMAFDPATGKLVLFGGAATTAGGADETWTYSPVIKQSTTLFSTPSGSVALGGKVSDQALLKFGSEPKGAITFRLYGPANSSCIGSPVYTSPPVKVEGNQFYDSPEYEPTAAGTYNWTVFYSGDGNNDASEDACGAGGTVTVTPATTTTTTTTTSTTSTTTATTSTSTTTGTGTSTSTTTSSASTSSTAPGGANGPASTSTPATNSNVLARGVTHAAGFATVKLSDVFVQLACTGGAPCGGTLKLLARVVRTSTIKLHGKRVRRKRVRNVVIGTVTFSIAQGASETVTVHLSAQGKALLGKAGRRGLKVAVEGTGIETSSLVLKEATKVRKSTAAGRAMHSLLASGFSPLAFPFAR